MAEVTVSKPALNSTRAADTVLLAGYMAGEVVTAPLVAAAQVGESILDTGQSVVAGVPRVANNFYEGTFGKVVNAIHRSDPAVTAPTEVAVIKPVVPIPVIQPATTSEARPLIAAHPESVRLAKDLFGATVNLASVQFSTVTNPPPRTTPSVSGTVNDDGTVQYKISVEAGKDLTIGQLASALADIHGRQMTEADRREHHFDIKGDIALTNSVPIETENTFFLGGVYTRPQNKEDFNHFIGPARGSFAAMVAEKGVVGHAGDFSMWVAAPDEGKPFDNWEIQIVKGKQQPETAEKWENVTGFMRRWLDEMKAGPVA